MIFENMRLPSLHTFGIFVIFLNAQCDSNLRIAFYGKKVGLIFFLKSPILPGVTHESIDDARKRGRRSARKRFWRMDAPVTTSQGSDFGA